MSVAYLMSYTNFQSKRLEILEKDCASLQATSLIECSLVFRIIRELDHRIEEWPKSISFEGHRVFTTRRKPCGHSPAPGSSNQRPRSVNDLKQLKGHVEVEARRPSFKGAQGCKALGSCTRVLVPAAEPNQAQALFKQSQNTQLGYMY